MSQEKTIDLAYKFAQQGQMQLARRLTLKVIKADKEAINLMRTSPVNQGVLNNLTKLHNLYKGLNDQRI